MASIHKTALVPYSAMVMYNLVNDVDSYSDFLPWCGGSCIISQSESKMVAQVDINKAAFKQSFTTCNILRKNQSIKMELQDGPFKKLSGEWLFHSLKKGVVDGCKIELILNWEFNNGITSTLLGGVFTPIANKMVDSFVKRSHELNEDN